MIKQNTQVQTSIVCYVDGGCAGNGTEYSRAYGSYQIGTETVQRMNFPEAHTNNESEYNALKGLLNDLSARGIYGARIKMDSALVVNQVGGRWKIKEARLRPLCARARELMQTTRASLTWVKREEVESVLGH